MRSPRLTLSLALLLGCSGSRDRFTSPPPPLPLPPVATAPPPASFEQPFFIPAAEATATPTATSSEPEAPAEIVPCLTEASGGPKCIVALQKIAKTGAGRDQTMEVYQRACEAKERLLGCQIFYSTAITDADNPIIESLMLCEHGAYEACEGLKPKAAPLIAWLQTLKGKGCDAGANALCDNFRQCKPPKRFTCSPEKGKPSDKICGCLEKCSGTVVAVETSGKKWPDGSARGQLGCVSSQPAGKR
ncbi:MAG: hypothetical protein JNL21_24425 [Myxococcales bacterium]|nr:hypothetical protein [Myxococcales bacterium]